MAKSFSLRKQVLFLSIIFIGFFLLLELSYRTYQRFNYGIPLFLLSSDVQTNETAVAGATALAVTNPLLHYVLNPNKLSHTKDNFRITGRVESPDYTIVCMGGSSTYGTSVPPAESYPAQLQFFLNQRQHQPHNKFRIFWLQIQSFFEFIQSQVHLLSAQQYNS